MRALKPYLFLKKYMISCMLLPIAFHLGGTQFAEFKIK